MIDMQSIAFFNNKGGVGKTTLVCNLASYLGLELEKKILIVDADSQCNSTQVMLSEAKVYDLYGSTSSAFTINNITEPLAAGKGYIKNLRTIEVEDFGVSLLPGDPRLALAEDLLASDWRDAVAGSTRGIRTTYLFSDLLKSCQDYDYVFFDMGPSLGAINRSILLAVDYFIVPMTIDIFSLYAVKNISYVLERWEKQINFGFQLNEGAGDMPVEKPGKIMFAGYVTQQYKAKKDASGKTVMVDAYEKIRKQIDPLISDVFRSRSTKGRPELGSIPYLSSIVPSAQMQRLPIFRVKTTGAHHSRSRNTAKTFQQIYKRLSDNID